MANGEEPVEKALVASSLAAITSEDSVNSNLVTLMVDSERQITPSATPSCRTSCISLRLAKFSLPGELCWTVRRKACCKALSPTITATKVLVRVNTWWCLGLGTICSQLVMTTAKRDIVTILDFENPRLEGFNVTVPLRNESGDLYSFGLDLSADRYGAKELAMDAVSNVQVWYR